MEKYKITLDYVQNKSANRAYKHFFKNDLLTGKKSILLEGKIKILFLLLLNELKKNYYEYSNNDCEICFSLILR